VIPEHPAQIAVVDVDLPRLRRLYLQHAVEALPAGAKPSDVDLEFLAADTRSTRTYVEETLHELGGKAG